MKTEFLEKKRFFAIMSVLTGGFGVVMMVVAVRLWRLFDLSLLSLVSFGYGCFLLLVAFHVWRNRCHFTEQARSFGYWLTSSALIFSAVISLITAPNITSLPVYHPKTLACLVMVVAGGVFAAKASSKKPAA